MRRYKLTIEYEGTEFFGFQRQADGPSVQQFLEEAIEKFSGEKVVIFAAGRTDSGVHAYGQVAHFDLQEKEFEAYVVTKAINFHLKPHKIAVTKCEIVDENFHARFNAKNRIYKYIIINRTSKLVIGANLAWHIVKELDIEKMKEAAKFLEGEHDFTSFRAAACQAKSPMKTIDYINIEKSEDRIVITIKAKSFLHHMVRNIVGSLKFVGEGKWRPEDMKLALDAKDRSAAGPTAPPQGLFFCEVEY